MLVHDDLFESTADLLVVTTNASLDRSGDAVMGRGAAKEAVRRWPWLLRGLGNHIRGLGGKLYGFLAFETREGDSAQLGCFQVKMEFHERARLDIIRISMKGLLDYVEEAGISAALNFPCIGAGRLSREEVAPVIAELLEHERIFVHER